MIHYIVFIKNVSTGETREIPWETPWEDHSEFLWEEGNYACDCNRELFFARVAGEPDPDGECGNERFEVWIDDTRGNSLYDDRRDRS